MEDFESTIEDQEKELLYSPNLTDSDGRYLLFTSLGDDLYSCSQIAGTKGIETLTNAKDTCESINKAHELENFGCQIYLENGKLIIGSGAITILDAELTLYKPEAPEVDLIELNLLSLTTGFIRVYCDDGKISELCTILLDAAFADTDISIRCDAVRFTFGQLLKLLPTIQTSHINNAINRLEVFLKTDELNEQEQNDEDLRSAAAIYNTENLDEFREKLEEIKTKFPGNIKATPPKEKALAISEKKPTQSAIDIVLNTMGFLSGGLLGHSQLIASLHAALRGVEFDLNVFCKEYGLNSKSQQKEIEEYRNQLGDCLNQKEEDEAYDYFWNVIAPLLDKVFPGKIQPSYPESKSEKEEKEEGEESQEETQSSGKLSLKAFVGALSDDEFKAFWGMITTLLNFNQASSSGNELFKSNGLEAKQYKELKTCIQQRKWTHVFPERFIDFICKDFPEKIAVVKEEQAKKRKEGYLSGNIGRAMELPGQILATLFPKLNPILQRLAQNILESAAEPTQQPILLVWHGLVAQMRRSNFNLEEFCSDLGIQDPSIKELISTYNKLCNPTYPTVNTNFDHDNAIPIFRELYKLLLLVFPILFRELVDLASYCEEQTKKETLEDEGIEKAVYDLFSKINNDDSIDACHDFLSKALDLSITLSFVDDDYLFGNSKDGIISKLQDLRNELGLNREHIAVAAKILQDVEALKKRKVIGSHRTILQELSFDTNAQKSSSESTPNKNDYVKIPDAPNKVEDEKSDEGFEDIDLDDERNQNSPRT